MNRIVLTPFVTSVFLSAFLLFLIQPMVTQMLLPYFGGSPAVWNTALVFFQVVLLLGYLYAHAITRLGSWKLLVPIHLLVLTAPLSLLPPGLPAGFLGTESARPSLAVLGALAIMVGLPFFTLSTNSSLIQHWWGQSGRPHSEDPYWLYGASNLGSLLALLSFPFLLSPNLDIGGQTSAWSWGYALFFCLTAGSLALATAWGRKTPTPNDPVAEMEPLLQSGSQSGPQTDPGSRLVRQNRIGADPSRKRVMMWVVRSAVASSLLLSVTMAISSDVGSVPLFWVIPLAVYLVTFILAFSFTDRLNKNAIRVGAVVTLATSLGFLVLPHTFPFGYALTVLASIAALFFGALFCHHQLALDRPDAGLLTRFYLWISLGGALGGILNSLLAPIVFESVAEYPLTLLALSCLLYTSPGDRHWVVSYRPSKGLGLVGAVGLLAPLFFYFRAEMPLWGWAVAVSGTVLLGLAIARYAAFLVVLSLSVCLIHFGLGREGLIAQERSFFGVVRVYAEGDLVTMIHGSTVHGIQNRSSGLSKTPLTYFHPSGPMGSVTAAMGPGARIGIVGLGTGSLAALADDGQEIVFHEIDPLIVRLAQEHFTFLRESRGSVRIVVGDGRLTLADVPDDYYDLLVLDAFSSDFIPIHLLTTEALELFLSKITPDGLLLLHLSNRFARLSRVVKGASTVLDKPVLIRFHSPSKEEEAEGAAASLVAAMARNPEVLEALGIGTDWAPPSDNVDAVVWTDSKASLVSVLW